MKVVGHHSCCHFCHETCLRLARSWRAEICCRPPLVAAPFGPKAARAFTNLWLQSVWLVIFWESSPGKMNVGCSLHPLQNQPFNRVPNQKIKHVQTPNMGKTQKHGNLHSRIDWPLKSRWSDPGTFKYIPVPVHVPSASCWGEQTSLHFWPIHKSSEVSLSPFKLTLLLLTKHTTESNVASLKASIKDAAQN